MAEKRGIVTYQGSSAPRPVTRQVFNQEVGSQHPLRLLVVEDNEINQKLVVSILGRLGYQAELANNGVEALKILQEKTFDGAERGLPNLPPPAAAPTDCTFDLSVLREFSEVMGEGGMEMAKELVRMYQKNSMDLIDEIQGTLDDQNFTGLQRAAHTLKGNSSQVGAARLSGLCFILEQIAKNGNPEGAQALLEQINLEFGKVEGELDKVLQLSERAW